MLIRINIVLALSLIFICSTVHSREQDPRDLFDQANIEMDNGNLNKSLSLFQQVQSIQPDVPNVIWNIGTLALVLEDYGLATRSWIKMRELEPNEWRVIGKLAQASKGSGDIDAFKRYREELIELYKKGDDPDLSKQERFLVEQLPMPEGRIFVYQYFSPLSQELAIFYQAVLVDKESSVLVRTSLGSYATTNELHKSLEPDTNKRMYHFDLYENDGSHRLLGMLPSEFPISYENAVPVLVNAIKKWIEVP